VTGLTIPDQMQIARESSASMFGLMDTSSSVSDVALNGSGVLAATFRPDGTSLLVAKGDSTLSLVEVSSGRILASWEQPGPTLDVAINAKSNRVAVGGEFGSSRAGVSGRVFDTLITKVVAELRCSHTRVVAVAFDPSGHFVATVSSGPNSQDLALHLWNVESGHSVGESQIPGLLPVSLTFSPDGKRIVLGLFTGLAIWDSSLVSPPMVRGGMPISSVQYTPTGALIVAAGIRGVELRDGRSGILMAELKGHDAPVSAVAVDPAGNRIASAEQDGTVRVWDLRARELLLTLKGPGDVRSLLFNQQGTSLAAIGRDTIRVWDSGVPKRPGTLRPPH
jgi:WD40 repeat protein